jgi:predicted amidophosphoribosyltransferase
MKDVESCPTCGVQLESTGDVSKEEIRKKTKTERAEESKPSLFMCPECGAFMSENATICPICNTEIVGEEDESEQELEETEVVGTVTDVDSADEGEFLKAIEEKAEQKACGVCGSKIQMGSDRCLVCNSPIKDEETLGIEALEKLEDMIEVMKCPLCGTELSKDATACYNCGTEFSGVKTEYTEDEIDKFFKNLDRLETRRKEERIEPDVAEEVEVPAKKSIPKPVPKLKKAAVVASTPTVRERATRLKPERKYEFLFYATIMTLIIHYAGLQLGLDTIWFGAILLYGSIFVICIILALVMREIRALSRKLLFQMSGFVLSISVPLRWHITGPNPFDIPLLIAGAILLFIGLFFLEEKRVEVWPVHLYLTYGVSLFFFSSIYAVGHLATTLEIESILVWVVGIVYVLFGFVLMAYRKLFVPVILGIDDVVPEAGPEGITIDRRVPKRVYDDEVPWYSKASALLLLDRYKEALECVEIAIKINDRNEIAWVIKGNAQSKLGNQLDALKSFNEAIKLNPSYEVAWNNKGNALARMKKYDEALRCYNEAIKLSPEYREAWVNKGYVLAKLGKFKDAAECAEKVISIVPKAKAESSASG